MLTGLGQSDVTTYSIGLNMESASDLTTFGTNSLLADKFTDPVMGIGAEEDLIGPALTEQITKTSRVCCAHFFQATLTVVSSIQVLISVFSSSTASSRTIHHRLGHRTGHEPFRHRSHTCQAVPHQPRFQIHHRQRIRASRVRHIQ